jgi:cobalt-zinc-cadmium efflux system membrane fusion protein
MSAPGRLVKLAQLVGVGSLIAVVAGFFLFGVLGVRVPGISAAAEPDAEKPPRPVAGGTVEGVTLVEGRPHTLQVPEDVRLALGVSRKGKADRVVAAEAPKERRPLVLHGSTALDPARLVRVRARFAPCEVVQIGQHVVPPGERRDRSWETQCRELRPGDEVRKGDSLGVFFSVDVGSKKNDLLDALVQLQLDQQILDRVEKATQAVPEVYYLTQVRAVQGDRNAVARALNNLKVWNIPQEEIDALHDEAKKIAADKDAWNRTPEGRWVRGEKQGKGGKVDPDAENNNPWGKVTLRAPFDGVIVERNCTLHEIVVDNTINCFQIADVSRLLVIANAPEDELPSLNTLEDRDRWWTVQTVGAESATGLKGPVEEVGYLIDPNQHTAVIKGYINNPGKKLRAGQYVSATVLMPPPEGVVEIPADAVVEDGPNAVVFVETDPGRHQYTLRRVWVTQRFDKKVFVRSTLAFLGRTEAGSKVVSHLSRTKGLSPGQAVDGPGVPAGTSIEKIDPQAGTLTLSRPATVTGARVSLEAWEQEPLTAEEKEMGLLPREPLRKGERILETGVGELKAALLDLESRPAKDW